MDVNWLRSPTLFRANNSESNDSSDDQQADNRHNPIKITPPSRAGVPYIFDSAVVLWFGLLVFLFSCSLVNFRNVMHWSWWQRQQGCYHPSYKVTLSVKTIIFLLPSSLTDWKDEACNEHNDLHVSPVNGSSFL